MPLIHPRANNLENSQIFVVSITKIFYNGETKLSKIKYLDATHFGA